MTQSDIKTPVFVPVFSEELIPVRADPASLSVNLSDHLQHLSVLLLSELHLSCLGLPHTNTGIIRNTASSLTPLYVLMSCRLHYT